VIQANDKMECPELKTSGHWWFYNLNILRIACADLSAKIKLVKNSDRLWDLRQLVIL